MRPVPEVPGVELGIHLSPPISFSRATPPKPAKCDARTCPWWPYSNSKEFKTNTVMILTILFCALISALAFNATIRYLLRHRRTVHHGPEEQGVVDEQQSKPDLCSLATMVFSAGMNMVGAEAECSICLSEFIDGEEIRVLGRCNHGFHVQCIQTWLSSRSSCPTCRATCFPPSSSDEITGCHQRHNS
ncbi:unnamed protein product [Ilex paraguariensis]|uniref:RING-type E3 ubiquitin transferase n=1 Tax=Ilex paraguariensis TaxID=185542 RepID=A0ABC8TDJ5_9AQUA